MSGDILNPESVMEYHPQSGILSVNFRNMVKLMFFVTCYVRGLPVTVGGGGNKNSETGHHS